MQWGFIFLILLGLTLICAGFYGTFLYNGKKNIKNLLSILIPLGLIIAILGVILTVLPDFFKETVW